MSKKKKPSITIEKTAMSKQPEITYTLAFWGLAILLFLPPYFRGLYFQSDQEWALIFAAVVFWFAWLWKWYKRDYSFISSPLDYFVLLLPVLYLNSALQAVNYGCAVDEVVKTVLYFLVYWLSVKLSRDETDVATILKVIYISAVGVALAGLATAAGIIYIKDGFMIGRIFSTFQYPNALASFLAALTIIGIYLWLAAGWPKTGKSSKKETLKNTLGWLNSINISQFLYASGNFLIFTVLLGTKSNGGLIVFAIIFVIYMIGLPKGNKIKAISHFVMFGVPSLIAIWLFLSTVVDNRAGALLWILFGLVLTLAGQWLYELGDRKSWLEWISIHKNKVILASIILFVAAVASFLLLNGDAGILEKIKTGLRLRNLTERSIFYKDALSMILDRPYLGWGGGGWKEAYRTYQSYLYVSSQVHSYYVQVALETGILGIIALIGIWVSFFITSFRAYFSRQDHETRLLVWTVTMAALLIGLHAAIDLDLSLSALSLVLFSMFGITRAIGIYSRDPEKNPDKNKSYKPLNYKIFLGFTIPTVLIIVCTSCLAASNSFASQADKYLVNQDIEPGTVYLQKAIAYNPLKAELHFNLSQVYKYQGKAEESLAEARISVDNSKYNPENHMNLAKQYRYLGRVKEAVDCSEKAVRLAPYMIESYEGLAGVYLTAGINELGVGNLETAKMYFDNTVKIPATLDEKMGSLDDERKKLWKDAPYLAPTPEILVKLGAARYFLRDWDAAESNLLEALKNDNTSEEAMLWLCILKDKQGKGAEVKQILEKIVENNPQINNTYKGLTQLPLIE